MTTFEQSAHDDATAAAEARMAAFRQQLQAMRVPGARSQVDRILSIVAVVAMVGSIVLALVAAVMSHGESDALEQNDAVVLAIVAVTIGIVGVGLFVKQGVERLLRFWIARVIFEHNTQTDRLLAQGEELQQLMRAAQRDRDPSPAG